MEKIKSILIAGIHSAVISQKQKNVDVVYDKILIKPFLKSGETFFQFCFTEQKKVTHKNVDLDEASNLIHSLLLNEFFQCMIYGSENDFHITSFSKKIKFKSSKPTKKVNIKGHDRDKNYILSPTEPFLTELDICTKDGKVKKEKYHKYRQINKYLEFIDSMKDKFPKNRIIRVVDFGCGKAYLSFALYYYLTVKLNLDAMIIGLDLKKDVVKHCQTIADKLNFKGLHFEYGDIGKYKSDDGFDMVISLHACDTATDEALYQAVKWKSKVILAVPCCQHELNPQLSSETNKALLGFGLMRERLATLLTDTSRALLLETVGYKCEIAEFIETEHTPKNVLIKAVYTGEKSKKSLEEYKKLKEHWNFTQRLDTLLNC